MTADLRALATRATRGPWRVIRCETPGYRHVAFSRKAHEPYTIGPALPADSAYIAAASPDVVLALLDREAALEEALDVLVGMCETGGDVEGAVERGRALLEARR